MPESAMPDANGNQLAFTPDVVAVESNPQLGRNRSFWSFVTTSSMGAFNDNLFKQAVLLMAVTALAEDVTTIDFQTFVMAAFALPFLLFSGIAGDLADHYSKGRVIVWCKIAEIVVMGLATLAFLFGGGLTGLILLTALAFTMGAQSAFYGPPKYSCIPEMVRQHDIPKATGITSMTTMMAIILGMALAGIMLDAIGERFWIVGLACVGVAAFGTWTATHIKQAPPAKPEQPVNLRSTVSVLVTIWQIIRKDPLLLIVTIVESYFWFLGAVTLSLLNTLGKLQFGLQDTGTSILVGTISLGIAIGGLLGGVLSRGTARLTLCFIAMLTLGGGFLWMGAQPFPAPPPQVVEDTGTLSVVAEGEATAPVERGTSGPDRGILETDRADPGMIWTVIVILFFIGVFSGTYMVPLLSFIQLRPTATGKGRMLAVSNFANFVFISGASLVYWLLSEASGYRSQISFTVLGVANLVVALVPLPLALWIKRQQADHWIGTFEVDAH